MRHTTIIETLTADIAATRKKILAFITERNGLNRKAVDPVTDNRRWHLLWAASDLGARMLAMKERSRGIGRPG